MTNPKIRRLVLALSAGAPLLLIGVAGVWLYYFMPPIGAPHYEHGHLTIERADGQKFPFDIEIARTPRELEYGLMFRRSMLADAGMLFLYPSPQDVSMWMKNTIMPLDMIFIREDGSIAKIATHTEPYNLTPISSGEPVAAAIEVNAGTADRLGLAAGDKVLYVTSSGQ